MITGEEAASRRASGPTRIREREREEGGEESISIPAEDDDDEREGVGERETKASILVGAMATSCLREWVEATF